MKVLEFISVVLMAVVVGFIFYHLFCWILTLFIEVIYRAMKAWKIKRLRRRILSKGYYEERLEYWLHISERLETFYKFKCSYFFVGAIVAEHNLKLYNRDRPRVDGKVMWYERKLIYQTK